LRLDGDGHSMVFPSASGAYGPGALPS
jgi:hypothetical protein